ncbi:hypothetical protein BpHYR1_031714 [Brachionus plicatilis]|uniref:Uncharacterized protein n=1 Tax=Brachionus plicatilis TaxID=10195 RepID=A0A3M7PCQ6_BRAPC|nr:hypothetical protein BpHYR1_031714 [Brachionus plicatilis]
MLNQKLRIFELWGKVQKYAINCRIFAELRIRLYNIELVSLAALNNSQKSIVLNLNLNVINFNLKKVIFLSFSIKKLTSVLIEGICQETSCDHLLRHQNHENLIKK